MIIIQCGLQGLMGMCISVWEFLRKAAVHPHGRDSGRRGYACRGGTALKEHSHSRRNGKVLLRKKLVPVFQPRHIWGTHQGLCESVCIEGSACLVV